MKTYNELIQYHSYEDRFAYLRFHANVGYPTFGHERYMNQHFYTSYEWRKLRDEVIARDNGCDLGLRDYPISGKIIIHHIVPITPEMLKTSDSLILDPNNLISCSFMTHNSLHFGNDIPDNTITERKPNDTSLW